MPGRHGDRGRADPGQHPAHHEEPPVLRPLPQLHRTRADEDDPGPKGGHWGRLEHGPGGQVHRVHRRRSHLAHGHQLAGSLVAGEDGRAGEGRWRVLRRGSGPHHRLLRLLLLGRRGWGGGLEAAHHPGLMVHPLRHGAADGMELQGGLRQEPVPVQLGQPQGGVLLAGDRDVPVRRPERGGSLPLPLRPLHRLPALRRLQPPEPAALQVLGVGVRVIDDVLPGQERRRRRAGLEDRAGQPGIHRRVGSVHPRRRKVPGQRQPG